MMDIMLPVLIISKKDWAGIEKGKYQQPPIDYP